MQTSIQHALLMSLVTFVFYSSRAVPIIAIISMVESGDKLELELMNNGTCSNVNDIGGTRDREGPFVSRLPTNRSSNNYTSKSTSAKFKWSEDTIGLLHSSFYIGYSISIIPMTIVAQKIGFFNFFTCALSCTILTTVLFPPITILYGSTGAIVMRILCGVAQSATTTMITGSLYYWSLRSEITIVNGIISIGTSFGAPAMIFGGSALIQAGHGWEMIFYFTGASYVVILIIFLIKATEKPEESEHFLNPIRPLRFSKLIHKKELKSLQEDRHSQRTITTVDWYKVVTSRQIWLFNIAWFCGFFSFTLYSVYQIRYYKDMLGMSMGKITNIFGIQVVVLGILIPFASIITDWARKALPTPMVRKMIYIVLYGILTILSQLFLSMTPCGSIFVCINMTAGLAACGIGITCAIKPVSNEIGGKFATQVYAFSNTCAQAAGIIAPVLFGKMLSNGEINEFETWIGPGLLTIGFTLVSMVSFSLGQLTLLPFTSDKRSDLK